MVDVINFLKAHNHFLLITHLRPDGDSLGSAAALCLALRSLGKTAYLFENPETTAKYLPFVEEFHAPPNFKHSKVVTLDTATIGRVSEGFSGKVDLRIDHHPGDGNYAEIDYTIPSAAACGEVVHDVLKAMHVDISQEIATCLYIAIASDTGCFRFSNTTSKTHRHAAEFIETGIDTHRINSEIFKKSRTRLAIETAISQKIEYYAGGLCALASLSLLEKGDASEDDLDNLAGMISEVEGVKIALLLRETQEGNWRVSCRTYGSYDAGEICRNLGGGGHLRASAAELKDVFDLAKARKLALDSVWEVHPEIVKLGEDITNA